MNSIGKKKIFARTRTPNRENPRRTPMNHAVPLKTVTKIRKVDPSLNLNQNQCRDRGGHRIAAIFSCGRRPGLRRIAFANREQEDPDKQQDCADVESEPGNDNRIQSRKPGGIPMLISRQSWLSTMFQTAATTIASRMKITPAASFKSQRGRVSCNASVTRRLRSASRPHSGQGWLSAIPRRS